jgi:Raf kinase inhibitor-like YbhB/YbcL family protein
MPIPEKFTGFGPDVSPPLSWSGTPSGTQSLALIMDDPDAPFGTFNHWMIFNLPPDSTELPENMPSQARLSDGSRQLRNGMLKYGYSGPHPPPGKVHHYNFVLCALDRVLPADGIDTKANLQEAMKGHILGQARLTGTCKR